MNEKTYKRYVTAWDKYWKSENEYFQLRESLIKAGGDDRELRDLDIKYGHDGFNPQQFGPWTTIWDKNDLLDLNFILPGRDKPFLLLENTDHDIPQYFGHYLRSELGKDNEYDGVVVGYGYDAGDDYIITEKPGGKRMAVLVNSHYNVDDA